MATTDFQNPEHTPNPETSMVNVLPTEIIRIEFNPWPAGKPEPPSTGRPLNTWGGDAGVSLQEFYEEGGPPKQSEN